MVVISESSTARASQDSLYCDVLEQEDGENDPLSPDLIAPSYLASNTPGSVDRGLTAQHEAEKVRTCHSNVSLDQLYLVCDNEHGVQLTRNHQRLHKAFDRSTLAVDLNLQQRYQIKSLGTRDDMDLMKPWKRSLYLFSSVLALTAFLSYLLYFGLRIHFTIAA